VLLDGVEEVGPQISELFSVWAKVFDGLSLDLIAGILSVVDDLAGNILELFDLALGVLLSFVPDGGQPFGELTESLFDRIADVSEEVLKAFNDVSEGTGLSGTEDIEESVDEFITRWPVLRGKRLAISMGRIHPKKGTDILIEAFAKTLANDPQWHLVIAGPDETGLQPMLEKLSKRLGISDRITWTGMLEGTAKWGALAASELFVLPSHQENFGIVVAEAMACKLPVILSNKVNIWREVADHRAGLVCDDNVESTAKILAQWRSLGAEEIAGFRARSKECFDASFNYDRTAKRVLQIIEGLAQQVRQT
jgi:glycosyltransferase involved in cell wall biosynthesis